MFLSEKKSIGLDISDKSVEIVEIEKCGDQVTVLSRARAILEPGIVEFGRIKRADKLKEVISQVLAGSKGSRFSAGRVVFGLPESQVFLRNIAVKDKQKNLINSLVLRELQFNVPAKDSNLLWTYRSVDCEQEGRGCRIFLAAIIKDFFVEWNGFLQQFGWGEVIFDIETLANCRSIFGGLPAKPTVLVDIGSAYSNIFVYDQSGLVYSYSHPVAGDVITKALLDACQEDISWAEAENRKMRIDLSATGRIEDAMKQVIDSILREVDEIIDFCRQKHDISIENLVLLGGGSRLIGIERYCRDFFGKDKRMDVVIGKSVIAGENDNLFLESLGLAMRGVGVSLPHDIDLSVIKMDNKEKRVFNKRLLWIEDNLKLLMFSAVFVCLISFLAIYFYIKRGF